MPTFTYKAKRANGEIIQGTLEADSRRLVIARIQKLQAYPLKVEESGGGSALHREFTLKSLQRVGRRDVAAFTRQMSDLLHAGLTLVRSLDVLVQQAENPKFKEIIKSLRNEVQGGSTFSAALSKHPKVFPGLYSSMVRAGEVGGLLDEVMERLADFSEAEIETRGKVMSALAYPIIMMIVGVGVIIVLMTFVIPRFSQMFIEMEAELPPMTQLLVDVSNFFVSPWALIPVAIVGLLGYAYYRAMQQPEERYRIDQTRLKIPIYGRLVQKNEVARFARTLGTLLNNGVPILQALEITRAMIKNQVFVRVIDDVSDSVREGDRLSSRMAKSDCFPPIAVNMVAVGEETGSLETTLVRVADTFEKDSERQLNTLTTMVEPLMILIMGAIVGFIVMAMILPIFQLTSTLEQ